jgi:hypothetical protein
VSVDLIAIMLCITYNAALVFLPNTTVTLAVISILAATSNTSLEITIAITNLYKA